MVKKVPQMLIEESRDSETRYVAFHLLINDTAGCQGSATSASAVVS